MKKIKVSEKTMKKIQKFLINSGGIGISWAVGDVVYDAVNNTSKGILGLFNLDNTVPGSLLSGGVSCVSGIVAGAALTIHYVDELDVISGFITDMFFEVKPEETETE